MKNALKTIIIWAVIITAVVMITTYLKNNNTVDKSYSELVAGIQSGDIKKVEISSDNQIAVIEAGDKKAEINIPSIDEFLASVNDKVSKGEVEVKRVEQGAVSKFTQNVLPTVVYGLLAVILAIWVFIVIPRSRRPQGQAGQPMTSNDMMFGKSKAKRYDDGELPDVTFDDVAGIDEEKGELQEIVDFLKNAEKYTEMGARIPKGVLLVGRPGTGKTLLAKAVAGEAGVPFYIISGSDFVEMYVGVGAKRVREMFMEAKKNSPSIIFIDEIDAVGRQRGTGLGGGHDEREQTLNQLLVEMDGFGKNEGVIIIAATNRPDVLDSALLRAGRFDRQIVVSMPDAKAREAILKVHAKNKKFADGLDLSVIAKNTPGFAGADLENVLNEAALLAARHNKERITMEDVEEAMVKTSMGPEKKSRVMSKKERKLVSYHEGGHAVVSAFLPTQSAVHEISIVPRGMAGGYTMYRSNEDKSFVSKREMEENIVSLLGGRLAEELIMGDISTGASNDIEKASKIARDMVMKYGMSTEVGTITYKSGGGEVFLGRDLGKQNTLSDKTAMTIDGEVKNIIDEAYRVGKEILEQNIDKLHAVAEVLMQKEKITGEEFDAIIGDKNAGIKNRDQEEEFKEELDLTSDNNNDNNNDKNNDYNNNNSY